ncbi:threonine ammonia-lyase [Desulfonema ishimotonii]|uniref:Threonine ammonia-lyase n=1 Tax=Desulfonema ishimotonii TaxID=45657 RepID=A0A401G2N4_9BACT|nr:threonine ammonia-lyase [Desulfonema ishimotonii]GBC63487.1 threonine ammonia-lyase [Desulfonema ishimotonii]
MKHTDIRNAVRLIRDRIIRTPLIFSPTLSRLFGAEIFLKLENLQKTGSFKVRGATYKLMKHRKAIGPLGVVAASAGNHAQGVALAARNAGVPATIVMPEWASISKQEATRSYGGDVILHGRSVGESLERAKDLAKTDRMFIHPFDDADIVTGQGTIGLEILSEMPDTDMILVPVGGGGLISGISAAVKPVRPDIRIIGVQASACPSAFESLRHGGVTHVDARRSLADGISVKQPGELTFRLIRKYAETVVLAEEEQIAAAILMLLERKKILAEGAGAVPLAALLNNSVRPDPDSKVVLVISGGNVDSPVLGRVIRKGLLKKGRIMRVRLYLEDSPGALSKLLTQIAQLRANVLHIVHDRDVKDLPISITYVDLELETRGPAHVDEIRAALKKEGYNIGLESYP